MKFSCSSGVQMSRMMLVGLTCLVLTGCKPDDVDLKLNTDDIASAIQGKEQMAAFEVTFSSLGDMKDDQKQDVEQLKGVVKKYVSVEDFRIEKAEYKTQIIVEGEIPVVYSKSGDFSNSNAAWVIGISDNTVPSLSSSFPYKVQLVATRNFDSLKSEAQSINFMLAPAAYGPTRMRLKNASDKSMKVLFGGAQSDSNSDLITEQDLSSSTTMIFKGGVYDEIGAGFYLSRF